MDEKKKTIVIDLDGVLLDIITPVIEHIWESVDSSFNPNDIKTYDFNQSLPDPEDHLSTEITDTIYSMFGNPDLFEKACFDIPAVRALKSCIDETKEESLPVEFVIYTKCYNEDVLTVKQRRIHNIFGDSVRFSGVIGKKTPFIHADAVIEDHPGALKRYTGNTMRCLVNRFYNSKLNNPALYENAPEIQTFDSAEAAIFAAFYGVKAVYKTRIIQYCLNQGVGILYETDPDVAKKGLTTTAEIVSAHAADKAARYVDLDVIDSFLHHPHPEQVKYAVEHHIDLIDFDEWQALQRVLFANTTNPDDTIPYKIAVKINGLLWEEELTPLELQPVCNQTQNIKKRRKNMSVFCETHKDVDLNNRESMIEFLTNHFRYNTMNSWNCSTSYANNVKLHFLPIPDEYKDLAYDVISGDVEAPYYDIDVRVIFDEFLHETGYALGFNGRSGGYIVMYDTCYSSCTKQYAVYPGRSIDQDEDFSDWEDDDIKERVKLVMKFDETCDLVYKTFLDNLKNSKVNEKTIYKPMHVRTLIPKEDEEE